MQTKKSSNLAIALIWFTAAISMAEILTGTWFAPLGWQQGLIAIVVGHFIGGSMFFCAGYIGAKTQKSAMQTVQISFGEKGSALFSLLNAMQLMGWTAVMIYMGADVISILNQTADASIFPFLTLGLGILIILWLLLGFTKLGIFAMDVAQNIKFGTAVEIAAVMPLSWLPVVSDHTKNSETPLKTTALSTLTYTATSCWMYALGLGAALVTGKSEISQILSLAGVSVIGVLIVIASTMINTALPAYSTGMSLNNIFPQFKVTPISVLTVIVGIILASTLPVTEYEHFLFFIGSVFAPMIAVLIADFFVLKQHDVRKSVDGVGLGVWFVGFVLYRFLMAKGWESDLGLTFPVIIITFILAILVRKITK